MFHKPWYYFLNVLHQTYVMTIPTYTALLCCLIKYCFYSAHHMYPQPFTPCCDCFDVYFIVCRSFSRCSTYVSDILSFIDFHQSIVCEFKCVHLLLLLHTIQFCKTHTLLYIRTHVLGLELFHSAVCMQIGTKFNGH